MTKSADSNPLNPVLRARAGLPQGAHLRLGTVRALLHVLDTLSRTLVARPFFALKESERLMRHLDGQSGMALVDALLQSRGGTVLIPRGLENVPSEGPVIIGATHPTGMFDYLAHAGALRYKRPDLKVVATAEASHFLQTDILVPVEAGGTGSVSGARMAVAGMKNHLDQGGALLVFGSGRVSHDRHGRLIEPNWRKGATLVSRICNAPLVPAALNARNSRYYYRMRACAQALSGGDEQIGAMFGSVRHLAEFMDKLGGRYELAYGEQLAPGTRPETLKSQAEGLFPGLYA